MARGSLPLTTNADLVDARKRLMEQWKLALKVAQATGYWADVDACARVIEAFHEYVADAIRSDAYSGDKVSTLAAWNDCGVQERNYRKTLETEARLNAPKRGSNAWWEVLGVAPSSPDDVVRAAYAARLKQCHPDRVAGLAPQLIQVAEDMAKTLNRAFEEAKRRPAWWIAH
jgi:hypothetical protein